MTIIDVNRNAQKSAPRILPNLIEAPRPEIDPIRGMQPSLILDQVRNTAPFLFSLPLDSLSPFCHLKFLVQQEASLRKLSLDEISLPLYFRLCLSAHHATVATFVPTDVDVAIREKLWRVNRGDDALIEMGKIVLASRAWDCALVSTRFVISSTGEKLRGHGGEWFSTAAAAYAVLRRKSTDLAHALAQEILEELALEERIFLDLLQRQQKLDVLRAATLIAHNLGDLERVFDAWHISVMEPLRAQVIEKVSSQAFAEASRLNHDYTAKENPRHFALRKPRCLRRHSDLLLPLGPFFDEWGHHVARHPGLTPREVGEVCEALIDGWTRLKEPTVGYARALRGIEEGFPGGPKKLLSELPSQIRKSWQTGTLRQLCSEDRSRFEKRWANYV